MKIKTIDEQIKKRLYSELKGRQKLLEDQQVIDSVLMETTKRLDDHVKTIVQELDRQKAVMGHLAELREQQHDLHFQANQTAQYAVNLADVFFRSDINLLIKHLELAEDDTITIALTHDPKLLDRIISIIERIKLLEKGIRPK